MLWKKQTCQLKLLVFQFPKEDEEAPENSDNQPLVEAPEVKKKKTAKKTTEKIRWKKEHIVSKPPSADFQDKSAGTFSWGSKSFTNYNVVYIWTFICRYNKTIGGWN